jgi:hypothetical protein
MNKERLIEIILDQKEVFNKKKHLIERDIELDKVINSSQVIIISGYRIGTIRIYNFNDT